MKLYGFMEYEFRNEKCNKCKKNCYCILHPDNMVYLCQDCFCWSIGYSDHKDKVNLVYIRLGMEDIENIRTGVI